MNARQDGVGIWKAENLIGKLRAFGRNHEGVGSFVSITQERYGCLL